MIARSDSAGASKAMGSEKSSAPAGIVTEGLPANVSALSVAASMLPVSFETGRANVHGKDGERRRPECVR